jgi:peptide/nickel transport system substrate-binding protein/microcin C transport system substrate-binding protein
MLYFKDSLKNMMDMASPTFLAILAGFLFSISGQATAPAPTSASTSQARDHQGVKVNTSAPIGGTMIRNLGAEPPTIHPIMATDSSASQVNSFIHDSLAERSLLDISRFEPRLAERWEESNKGLTYTFFLRKDAKFSDGKPVTAEDVKFSYEAIFIPDYKAARLIPYFQSIDRVEILDAHSVKVTFKEPYFQNFAVFAGMSIIPKHVYGDLKASKRMNRTAVGAGPYRLDKFDKGQRIVLRRNPDWYGFKLDSWKGYYNFDSIIFRFVTDRPVAFEMVKRGELDFEELTSEFFVEKAVGLPWGETVFKEQAKNRQPRGYNYIGWNLNRPLFQDRRVRLALYHLINREEMNKKFRMGMSLLATGPENLLSETANPSVKPVLFDPDRARDLLRQAGWSDTDRDGVLDKKLEGKQTPFRFSITFANRDFEKYLTMYQEDLRKSGIQMSIQFMEWGSFLRQLEDGNFDAVQLGWGGVADSDHKQIWHSSSAQAGGSNRIGYKNPKVDELIDRARVETDRSKRIALMRQIYQLIAEDVPYAFLFNEQFSFYAYSNKVQRPGPTFEFGIGIDTWWAKQP